MGYEKPMDSLSDKGGKNFIERHLNFQESVRPQIMDDYIVVFKDFFRKIDSFEKIEDIHLDAIPDDFREYSQNLKADEIFNNGVLSLPAVKMVDYGNEVSEDDSNFYNSKEQKIAKKASKELFNEYGFPAMYENIYNQDRDKMLASYIVSLPGKIVKENDKWVPEKDPNGNAKFFAMMTVLGLVEEQFILNEGISNLGVKGIEFRKFYEQELARLKSKGYTKIDASTLV